MKWNTKDFIVSSSSECPGTFVFGHPVPQTAHAPAVCWMGSRVRGWRRPGWGGGSSGQPQYDWNILFCRAVGLQQLLSVTKKKLWPREGKFSVPHLDWILEMADLVLFNFLVCTINVSFCCCGDLLRAQRKKRNNCRKKLLRLLESHPGNKCYCFNHYSGLLNWQHFINIKWMSLW